MKSKYLYLALPLLCILYLVIYLMIGTDESPLKTTQNAAANVGNKPDTNISDSAAPSASKEVSLAPGSFPKRDHWTWLATNGKIYNNVVITKIEGDRVTIRHSAGEEKVNMALLPYSIQMLLHYYPESVAKTSSVK